jgi:ABC-type sugar transport system substrate-binding protein
MHQSPSDPSMSEPITLSLALKLPKCSNSYNAEGGTFGVISTAGVNIKEREKAFHEELRNRNGKWTELKGSPTSSTSIEEALNQTQGFANLVNATAIALMIEGPMRADEWGSLVDGNRKKGIIYVSGDASEKQLDLLSRRKCHGLVGQLPYEMGFFAIKVLNQLVRNQTTVQDEIIGTNVVTHIQVPVVLPEPIAEQNRIGGLPLLVTFSLDSSL